MFDELIEVKYFKNNRFQQFYKKKNLDFGNNKKLITS